MSIKNKIIKKILKNNFEIRIDKFIEECLYNKDSYYIVKDPIGLSGDFITSPEISQMFGEILGLYILNLWLNNINNKFNLIELGPGKGTLLNDIIRVSKIRKNFLTNANILLVENNKILKNRQKKLINNIELKNVKWLNNVKLKSKLPSIIYANEFFDCIPVRQFYKKEYWFEKYIKYDFNNNIFYMNDKLITNKKILNEVIKYEKNKIAEISFKRRNIFNQICDHLKKFKGFMIVIDYGYYYPIKNFTLQSVSNHKKTHIFENIGEQDITSHVNFKEFIQIALDNKLKIETYCNQKNFLISNGIAKRKKNLLVKKSKKIKAEINLQYKKLTDLNHMGKEFKFLIVSSL
mgnify:CR=1 FL=1